MANRYFILPTGNSNWSNTNTWASLTSAYSTGTATFTQGSQTVNGQSTVWTAGMVGDYIVSPSGTLYLISGFTSTTQITISVAYAQATQTTVAYNIGTLSAVGASVPTSADSVYPGTIATGATLTVDATVYCLNMDWTGATNTPTLSGGGSSVLSIFGGLTFIVAMNVTYSKEIAFLGNGTFNVNFGSQTLYCHVSFNYVGSKWTLQNPIYNPTKYVYLHAGELDTANKQIDSISFTKSTSSVATLTPGSSVINIGSTGWNYTGSNLTLTANTATINVSGTGAFAGGTPTGSYYNINLLSGNYTVSGAFNANLITVSSATTQTITATTATINTKWYIDASQAAKTIVATGSTMTGSMTRDGGTKLITITGGTWVSNRGIQKLACMSITGSTAQPTGTWYAEGSVNGGSNVGWLFQKYIVNTLIRIGGRIVCL